jgi:hypothetical protein
MLHHVLFQHLYHLKALDQAMHSQAARRLNQRYNYRSQLGHFVLTALCCVFNPAFRIQHSNYSSTSQSHPILSIALPVPLAYLPSLVLLIKFYSCLSCTKMAYLPNS